ncbi:MAG: zinc ribbon domain-containing protein [Desulfosudis oleivorans]|nr:zinc ribbon domain-containing protein [Desulfosudis oleivorans]
MPALSNIENSNLFYEPETRDMNCPVCNNPVDPSKIFCPSCGTRNPGHDKVSMPKEKLLIYIAGGLILVVSLVLVFFLIINPMVINKKATKLYVIANNLKLRSSEYIDVSNSNVIRDVPFGSEVLVFEQNNEWARVKVKKQKGYMGSPSLYLKDKRSFHEIDAIFGNEDSRLALRSTRSEGSPSQLFQAKWLIRKGAGTGKGRIHDKYSSGIHLAEFLPILKA